jgi:hypothetical protein
MTSFIYWGEIGSPTARVSGCPLELPDRVAALLHATGDGGDREAASAEMPRKRLSKGNDLIEGAMI